MKSLLVLALLSVVIISGIGVSQVEALTFDSPRILDDSGSSVQNIEVNTQVKFEAKLVNNDDVEQLFLFSRIINDENGNLVSDDWMTSAIEIAETIPLAMSWIPESAGNYQIILQIFDHSDNVLTNSLILNLEVIEPIMDPSVIEKPIPEWVKGVFAFWADGQISDAELKEAIRFLVNSGLIIL